MTPFKILSSLAISLTLPFSLVTGCSNGAAEPTDACSADIPRPADYKPFFDVINPGGRSVGAVCAFDSQCASNRCSADSAAGTCGQCLSLRGIGQSCTGANEGCSTSAACQDGVCTSLRKNEGESCGLGAKGYDYEECDVEFFCAAVNGYGGDPGVCRRYRTIGECCGDGFSRCGPGLDCDSETSQCTISIPNSCINGNFCVGENICGDDKMCHPGTLPEHAPCSVVDGKLVDGACSPGLTCGDPEYPNGGSPNQATCIPLPKQGEPCQDHDCGEGLFCLVSMVDDRIRSCEVPRGEGEPCLNGWYYGIACAEGFECRGNVCRVACE